MKRLAFAMIIGLSPIYADQKPCSETIPTYAHRINFSLLRLGYEHIKPDAIYIGVECWFVWDYFTGELLSGLAEGEGRIGYNFCLNPSNTLTPFIGGGYFSSFAPGKQLEIGFSSAGFRYEHIFSPVFNLGLNMEAMLGYSLAQRGDSNNPYPGDPIWGIDVGVPFTWRFTRKRNWDFRLEPFLTGWFVHHHEAAFFGIRNAFGYRF